MFLLTLELRTLQMSSIEWIVSFHTLNSRISLILILQLTGLRAMHTQWPFSPTVSIA